MLSTYDLTDPEFQSVEAFIDYMTDDDREVFNAGELQALAAATHRPVREVRLELESLGLSLADRRRPRRTRGFQTSSHDRWYGPGSDPTHGGSGWSEITGMASREG